jgi:photosystem II stability/assembly factor-like uncharacterized protein
MKRLNILLTLTLLSFSLIQQANPQQIAKPDTIANLRDIFFIDEEYGWVVGSNGTIIKTTNGGINWEVIHLAYNEFISSVFFINRELGWITTTYNDKIYMTNNGGESWEHIATIEGTAVSLMDIFFVNDSTGFVCRSAYSIYRTTDYGYTWEETLGTFYGTEAFDFVDEDYGWAGGHNSFKITTNGGGDWTSIDLLTYEFFVSNICLLNGDNGFIVGYGWDNLGTDYNMFVSTNDGGNTLFHKMIDSYLFDVHFDSPDVGWIAGSEILKTTDGGHNWTTLNPVVHTFDFADDKSWGINFENRILFSDDGWKTATMQFPGSVNVENSENTNSYFLSQNFPNPFNPNTKIKFELHERVFVTLKIYDLLGNEINSLIEEEKLAGNYEIEFDGAELSSGIYLYKIIAGNFVDTKKMILLK